MASCGMVDTISESKLWIPDPGETPLPFEPARLVGGARKAAARFSLYVEGPRDRSILRAWSFRLLSGPARHLVSAAVILGGRRPDRAIQHFRDCGGAEAGIRGLCILDRDGGAAPTSPEPGLEIFTWGRRHIESYLLVPGAIRRALGLPEHDRRVERLLDTRHPNGLDERDWRELDAKRLLGPKGALARGLGGPLPLTRIAQATRESELHDDVHDVFARLRQGFEEPRPPEIVR